MKTQRPLTKTIPLIKKKCNYIENFIGNLENNTFKEEFLKTEKEKLRKIIQSKIDDKDSYALENCINTMYGDEGFGLFKFGNLQDIDKITKESITEHYEKLIQSAKIDIFISGKRDFFSVICEGLIICIQYGTIDFHQVIIIAEVICSA